MCVTFRGESKYIDTIHVYKHIYLILDGCNGFGQVRLATYLQPMQTMRWQKLNNDDDKTNLGW